MTHAKRLYLLWLAICLMLFLLSCRVINSLGSNPDGKQQKSFERLPNYHNRQFSNRYVPDTPHASIGWFKVWKQGRRQPPTVRPSSPLPVVKSDLHAPFSKPTVFWFGHSSFLLKTGGLNILADPVFNAYAGPFRGVVPAFDGEGAFTVKDLPPIDVLLISHDHYDHLDYTTAVQLKGKVKRVIVPVGVGSHFRKWGYPDSVITELYWGSSARISNSLKLTATPAHHRSNRTFSQNKTLWASYVIESDGYKIYFSGDTGYSPHFKEIGEQFGPFHLALLECGQYNHNWPNSHMQPEQTAQAAQDLRAQTVIPVHWGRFKEAFHPWNEPVERLLPAAAARNIQVSVPRIGESYTLDEPLKRDPWWREEAAAPLSQAPTQCP